jgi:hypothetical protein
VSADTTTIFVRLSDIVGTDRDKSAIANLDLTVEFKKPFSLSAILGAETTAAEDPRGKSLNLENAIVDAPVGAAMAGTDGNDIVQPGILSRCSKSGATRK